MNLELDATDLFILEQMQANARVSNAELARELNMAPSAVLERVRKLEEKKVITGYRTAINPGAVGQQLLAFIFIRAADGLGSSQSGLALAKIPGVQEVHHIAGEDCYLVKVRAADSAALMNLMRTKFSKIPNIQSTKTTIVLQTLKEEQQLVIPKK
ncbi:MAG TPA: Lrp/AsnC family transcriptional regulator [Puia sp.]|nr:Lrp/AsnC family transcriptional regulator [Puia sp.]